MEHKTILPWKKNAETEKNWDLFGDSERILERWKKYFGELLSAQKWEAEDVEEIEKLRRRGL